MLCCCRGQSHRPPGMPNVEIIQPLPVQYNKNFGTFPVLGRRVKKQPEISSSRRKTVSPRRAAPCRHARPSPARLQRRQPGVRPPEQLWRSLLSSSNAPGRAFVPAVRFIRAPIFSKRGWKCHSLKNFLLSGKKRAGQNPVRRVRGGAGLSGVVPIDGFPHQQPAKRLAVEGDQGIEIPVAHQGFCGGQQD